MLTVFTIKVLTQVRKYIDSYLSQLYADTNSNYAFPLNKGDEFLPGNSGIYWRKFQGKITTIPGMLTDVEATALFFLSVNQELKGDILEVGSWLGKSTVHLAQGCKLSANGVVHAVDTFKGNVGKEKMYTAPLQETETIYSRFKKNLSLANVNKQVKTHRTTSQKAFKKLKGTYRIVFIDGDHSYDGAAYDIKHWSRRVKKGGLLVLDDFTTQFPGVLTVVKEHLIPSKDFEFLFQYDSLLILKKVR